MPEVCQAKMAAVVYLHGQGGNAGEAAHYRSLFPDCEVVGLAYRGDTPWEAGKEIHDAVAQLRSTYRRVLLIANSIGAFFAMHADIESLIAHAWFISPIVDMKSLIMNMMDMAGISEQELRQRGVIPTEFGADLSWEYLCYVREHPVSWCVPTDILYGGRDTMTAREAVETFAGAHHATLTIMEEGEHWFYTDAQMRFLDRWIESKRGS